jgi:hypothetical protein
MRSASLAIKRMLALSFFSSYVAPIRLKCGTHPVVRQRIFVSRNDHLIGSAGHARIFRVVLMDMRRYFISPGEILYKEKVKKAKWGTDLTIFYLS